MSLIPSGLLWVGGVMIVTAVLAVILRRWRQREGREANNEVAGQVFTIVGGVNVVIAAFVLISLFDGMDTAGKTTYDEANALVAVQWAGESLAPADRARIQSLTRSYATEVSEQEWPDMRAGRDVSGEGWTLLASLQKTVEQAKTTSERQEDRRVEAANQVWNVYQARQVRLTSSGSGVSGVVWFAILIGSVMSVALMFMFGGPGLYSYAFIVSMLAGAIALLLFAIYQLQNPFSGGANVGPDAFLSALSRLTDGG
ncbi:bestrophin-like domain [Kribbella sp. NPDC055071]